MALDQSALLEVLKTTEISDRVRTATEHLYQALIDAELTSVIGTGPHERRPERTAQRNGSRPRTVTRTAVDLGLRIPKLRTDSLFPSLLGAAARSTRRCSPWSWRRTCTA
jgi:putative transposase